MTLKSAKNSNCVKSNKKHKGGIQMDLEDVKDKIQKDVAHHEHMIASIEQNMAAVPKNMRASQESTLKLMQDELTDLKTSLRGIDSGS
ncbi:MAG: hypothetical protein K0S30_109 [Clostridia bacterium]|jgi:hypothetical protein|nr:hypothetical protein [Clostridia bacterium]